ncbi:MAG TPA: hypothetical protein DCQ31_03875 [Bacteroidales bacterium]|nr:hypothetical protein [Bacteroidales bacterium]
MNLQLSVLNGERKLPNLIQNVVQKAEKLSKKASIPAVNNKMETILAVQNSVFWHNVSIPLAEKVRIELRDLLKFLDEETAPVYYTSFEGELEDSASDYHVPFQTTDLKAYKRNTEQYLREHSKHITIYKLRNNVPITKHELAELEKMLFEQGSLGTKVGRILA